ncbi:MAG: hypothetical protein MUW56_14060 [Chryseobacterium sp.]|uniref:hypothetical protein n=1 Tax=Chryseobacterium sp. TaxID=1871047 RepID=UPI0025BB18B9|nr:hypothetical protein [Chryseobacterium sp.]MCJ7934711.1 hypothetical protein [Chryseobacterium sp.]
MKKLFTILLSAIFLCSLNSCKINGNFKGLYSYYETTKKENPGLFIKNDNKICSLKYSKNIFIINGKSLKDCLQEDDKSLVYIWGPKCSSKVCIPLSSVQEYCTRKNIRLYIVAEYFDSEMMNKEYAIERPILGIDTEYYKTNLTKKYLTAFINDIAQTNYSEKRYLYFEKGELKDVQEEILLYHN